MLWGMRCESSTGSTVVTQTIFLSIGPPPSYMSVSSSAVQCVSCTESVSEAEVATAASDAMKSATAKPGRIQVWDTPNPELYHESLSGVPHTQVQNNIEHNVKNDVKHMACAMNVLLAIARRH